jgi:hypothetical protein
VADTIDDEVWSFLTLSYFLLAISCVLAAHLILVGNNSQDGKLAAAAGDSSIKTNDDLSARGGE